MNDGRVLIVEDDRLLADQLRWALKARFEVLTAEDAVQGIEMLGRDPDVVLMDLRLPPSREPTEGFRLLENIRQKNPSATVVVMTGEQDGTFALRAVELGAYDYFRKPVDPLELGHVLSRAVERHRIVEQNRELKEQFVPRPGPPGIIGSSAAIEEVLDAIRRVGPTDASVLLQGESGTGKELVAQALVQSSPRASKALVAVNSSALPESLAESELFGNEKGAFTGASSARPGKFELADGGTLFLDEIATLSPMVQAKLLRVLETREVERLGGRRPVRVDIRLIAATNEELGDRVRAGGFREDLFYRLNTVVLRLPPLRERLDDLPLLLDHFASHFGAHHRRRPKRFAPGAMSVLRSHRWPGNVRELAHLVEMLTLMVDEDEIVAENLPSTALRISRNDSVAGKVPGSLEDAVAQFERGLLVEAIRQSGGVKSEAARLLGLSRDRMKYLCRKYNA